MKRRGREQAFLAVGALLIAVGLQMFLTPNRLSAGGVSSVGTVLLYLFGLRLSASNLLLNGALFLLGYRCLGGRSVLRAALGAGYLSAFLELTQFLPAYQKDLPVAALCGGALIGAGVGLCVRQDASTGGSDFAGLILKRYFPHIPVAVLIFLIDFSVVSAAGLFFRSFTVTAYSVFALITSSFVADKVLTFGDRAKTVYIFSEKADCIADFVLQEFERGVSAIPCIGMYSGKSCRMLLCVVSPKQLPRLLQRLRRLDSAAFTVIQDAREVLGEGFKKLL